MTLLSQTSLLVDPEQVEELKRDAAGMRSCDLHGAQLAMLELLLAGYCAPLTGYLRRDEASSVLVEQRLPGAAPWSMPVLLTVAAEFAASIKVGDPVALRDPEGVLLAILGVEDIWSVGDLPPAAANEIARFHSSANAVFLGGRVRGIELPVHYDFAALRLTPDELRGQYAKRGWRNILACQPAEMIHRAEAARIVHAARVAQANMLVLAPVTEEQTITLGHYTRVRSLEHGLRYLPERSALLALIPMPASLHAGPEVLWRALLARNAGATHLLVDPEWWQGLDAVGRKRIGALALEAGIELVDLPRFARDSALGAYLPEPSDANQAAAGVTAEVIRRVRGGTDVPDWMSFPEVVDELKRSHPVRGRQGVTVFFTGLSGAGKSTIARVLLAKLLEIGERTATLLDGDIVRKNLSSELGFSREHRHLNIQRIGFVASEITKHGGIAICAPIAPYRITRRKVRQMVEEHGGFFEVHVATPLETCESRDRKGLYAKARAGLIAEFTGISDPYEAPENAELVIDTRACTPLEAAQMIVTRLESEGFVR